MGTSSQERTGVLILRAWAEGNEEDGLRVRIIRSIQGDTTEPVSKAAATVDDVCTVVRSWLEELLHEQEPLPPDSG
jgi:hypothetical protein